MLVVVHVQLSVAKSGKITTAEMKGKIPDEKINSHTLIVILVLDKDQIPPVYIVSFNRRR